LALMIILVVAVTMFCLIVIGWILSSN
jgi:hypothetical protein